MKCPSVWSYYLRMSKTTSSGSNFGVARTVARCGSMNGSGNNFTKLCDIAGTVPMPDG
jgi:hypothetical protein